MNEPVKYPLPCGCAGPKFVSKCEAHKNEDIAAHRSLMRGLGIPVDDLKITVPPGHCIACGQKLPEAPKS